MLKAQIAWQSVTHAKTIVVLLQQKILFVLKHAIWLQSNLTITLNEYNYINTLQHIFSQWLNNTI